VFDLEAPFRIETVVLSSTRCSLKKRLDLLATGSAIKCRFSAERKKAASAVPVSSDRKHLPNSLMA
jgi:hypothetical protein